MHVHVRTDVPSSLYNIVHPRSAVLHAAAGTDMAKVCPDCWRDLSRQCNHHPAPVVPKNSLVRVDAGKVPAHLPPLTALEAKLLAPYRYSKDMYLMKPKGRQDRPNDAYQGGWTSHVFVYPQAAGHHLSAVFPANFEDAAASINVIFLRAETSEADIPTMAGRSPALKVRRPILSCGMQWCNAHLYRQVLLIECTRRLGGYMICTSWDAEGYVVLR
jgi:hypothetical protein